MTKYEIILYWSEEDQAFIAEVPELPGCAADGSTRQEALAEAEWDDHYGAPLIPRTYGFRAPRQRLDRTRAANRDPVLHQRVQKIQEQVIEHLLGQRLVAGQPEGSGEFLADGEPHGVKLRLAAAIALIGQRHRRLHDASRAPVHVELAAREPAQVGRIGGIEEQQRALAHRGA